jgi:hypothetical protein
MFLRYILAGLWFSLAESDGPPTASSVSPAAYSQLQEVQAAARTWPLHCAGGVCGKVSYCMIQYRDTKEKALLEVRVDNDAVIMLATSDSDIHFAVNIEHPETLMALKGFGVGHSETVALTALILGRFETDAEVARDCAKIVKPQERPSSEPLLEYQQAI